MALIKKAEVELRETESRKLQSLEQFRDWLRRHQYIKYSRQDDTYLLEYLRTKKFSLNDACKLYENHFNFRSKRGDWFDITDEKRNCIKELVQCGSKYFINDPQSTDTTIFITRFEIIDLDKFSITDNFYTDFSLFGAYLELENVQICGFSLILDFTNVPLSIFASFPINDVLDWVRSLNCCPGRYKQFIIVQLPSTAHTLLNLIKMILPEKMKERIALVKDYDELANLVDVKRLPKYYGGNADERDLIKATLSVFDEKLPLLRNSHKYEIEWSKMNIKEVKLNEKSTVGSFRKLEID
ncbi:hypothetical protein PVAND_001366 [Polypedilum vanderplanki]|uniref:CRAL-TRIO domain-containing protein n=1 Tax=Polypedilum vanderplanki TaxID=319348 RepID=A0A9J6BMQ3_POLVA|nr:hypothetical protein PVAND_001366 [Polypedilum vanderplanki]